MKRDFFELPKQVLIIRKIVLVNAVISSKFDCDLECNFVCFKIIVIKYIFYLKAKKGVSKNIKRIICDNLIGIIPKKRIFIK